MGNDGGSMLPNLIVIGAMKAGTTSLHHYLSLHPEIAMSGEKELNFFIAERNWSKGPAWYCSHFPLERVKGTVVRGESSPLYTAHPTFAGVPERMRQVVPDARLIYVVRDPVERMISHYVHAYAARTEHREIEEALACLDGDNVYLSRSQYHMQLSRYLRFYAPASILVIACEDLYVRRAETMRRVFRFLGVDDAFTSRGFASVRHRSSQQRRKTRIGDLIARKGGDRLLGHLPAAVRWHAQRLLYLPLSRKVARPPLSARTRERLGEALKEDVSSLRALTGCQFPDWSV
jgi:hypothetical protein